MGVFTCLERKPWCGRAAFVKISIEKRKFRRSRTPLPGPKASEWIRRDSDSVSPSYTRAYPLVVEKGEGLWVQDPDGNLFLDFTAGIAVNSTGHCHPKVVEAIRDQAGKLIHMSGTDFYYAPQINLAEKLSIADIDGGSKDLLWQFRGGSH